MKLSVATKQRIWLCMNNPTRFYRHLSGLLLQIWLLSLSFSSMAQMEKKEIFFDIPSQSLSMALLKFSEQSKINVIASSAILEGFESRAIKGDFTYHSALQQILMGTGLVFDKTSKDTIVVVKPRVESIPEVTTEPVSLEIVIDELQVTGIRLSLTSALHIKRSTDAITDVISEEDMGKFPDANVLESLQRVTGVSIARGRAGEGQFITVRGLGQQFNLVTVNGRTLATDNIGREFSFDVLPSELIAGAQVYKTPLASLSEGSIGATVNMTTAKPFDRFGTHGSVSLGGLYDDLAEQWGPKLSGAISSTFAENRLGASLGIAYSKRKWRSDMVQSLGFGFSDIDLNQNGIEEPNEVNLQRPGYLAYPLKTGERERLGVTGTFQYKPNDHILTGLDLLYTHYKTPEEATYQTNDFFTPGFRPGSVEVDENGTVTRFVVDNYTTELATDPKRRKVDTWQVGWNTQWDATSSLKFNFDLAYSSADRPEGGKTKFWVAGIPGASAEFRAGIPIPSLRVTLADGRDISEARNDEIHVGFMESQGDDIGDEIASAFINAELDIDVANLSRLDFGIAYSQRKKSRVSTHNDACAYCNFPFSFGDLQMQGTKDFPWEDFLDGEAGFFPTFWPNLDADAIFDIVQAAEGNIIDPRTNAPYPQGYSNLLTPKFSPLRSSWIDEEATSAFAQLNFEGDRWYGNIGTRFSSTAVVSTGYAQDVIAIEPIPGGPNRRVILSNPLGIDEASSYFNFLPSANLALELNEDLLLRVSAAKTISRPSIAQLGFDINYETNEGISRKSYNGNPALDPIEADQFDVSAEWYISKSSLLNTALFYKRVSGFVSNGVFFENILGEDFVATKPVNNDDAEVTGLEFGLQYLFENGFGFQTNYTYADSSFNNSQLENFSKYSYNIIGIYERGNLSTRIALNYRDHYLVNGFGQGGRPETEDDYAQLDFRSSYKINNNLSFYVEGLNVTGETAHVYSEYKNRLIEYEKIGRRFSIGVRWLL